MQKYLIGIDEAGRGPLAGPVAVGVVCIEPDFNWDLLPGVNDSKKLSEKKREGIFKQVQHLKKKGKLEFSVVLVSARKIDTIGIVPSIRHAMHKGLKKLSLDPSKCMVKLDGSLYAPKEFIYQETIIKGDSKEKVIGLASIMAKVTRDRYMGRLARQKMYESYAFEVHKGYGTKLHRERISEFGLSNIHRQSFCTRLI